MEEKIREKLEGKKAYEITELNLDCCKSNCIVGLNREFYNLTLLSIKSAGLTHLTGLPILPNLLTLDLADNELNGGLQYLIGCKSLRILNLTGNRICRVKALIPLTELKHLKHLFLFHSPIFKVKLFRRKAMRLLPQLTYYNGLDKNLEEDLSIDGHYLPIPGEEDIRLDDLADSEIDEDDDWDIDDAFEYEFKNESKTKPDKMQENVNLSENLHNGSEDQNEIETEFQVESEPVVSYDVIVDNLVHYGGNVMCGDEFINKDVSNGEEVIVQVICKDKQNVEEGIIIEYPENNDISMYEEVVGDEHLGNSEEAMNEEVINNEYDDNNEMYAEDNDDGSDSRLSGVENEEPQLDFSDDSIENGSNLRIREARTRLWKEVVAHRWAMRVKVEKEEFRPKFAANQEETEYEDNLETPEPSEDDPEERLNNDQEPRFKDYSPSSTDEDFE